MYKIVHFYITFFVHFYIIINIMALIMMIYSIYAIIQEKQKSKYYKKTILYETNYDKYFTMVRKQKIVVLKKRLQLPFLKFFS